MKRFAAIFAVCTLGLSTAWALKPNHHEGHKSGENKSTKMTLAETPAAVQKTIRAVAGSATVSEVEKESDDGVTLYEAAWQVGDVEHEVNVNEAGEVMETEMVVAVDAVPEAVRVAAMKHMPKGAKPTFEKKMVVLYEIETTVDGKEVELLVDPSGRVMELEAGDHDDNDHEDNG